MLIVSALHFLLTSQNRLHFCYFCRWCSIVSALKPEISMIWIQITFTCTTLQVLKNSSHNPQLIPNFSSNFYWVLLCLRCLKIYNKKYKRNSANWPKWMNSKKRMQIVADFLAFLFKFSFSFSLEFLSIFPQISLHSILSNFYAIFSRDFFFVWNFSLQFLDNFYNKRYFSAFKKFPDFRHYHFFLNFLCSYFGFFFL